MPYGYLGQNTPNQTVSNSGVFSISDVADLEKLGKFGGSLELIEEQTISANVTSVDFINLEDNPFDIYLCNVKNLKATSDSEFDIRFSEDNGSSFISTYDVEEMDWMNPMGGTIIVTYPAYWYSSFRISSDGSTSNYTSLSNNYSILTDSYTGTGVSSHNSYFYLYNMLRNDKYSYLYQHSNSLLASSGTYKSTFGGGSIRVMGINNAFQVRAGTMTGGTIKLYGLKEL